MKAFAGTWYRTVAMIAFAAFGVATTLATGGGGGGGGTVVPPVDSGPTLAITVDNGEAVSTTVLSGVMLMFDVSDATGDPLVGAAAAAAPMLQKPRIPGTRYEAPFSDVVEACAVSGTVTLSGDVADPNTLTVGDTITAVFDNCDENEGYVIDGTLDATIAAFQGDPFTGVFLVTLDLVMTDLRVTDASGTATADGDMSLTLDSLDFPILVTALAGDELSISDANLAVTVEDYDHTLEVNTGLAPETFLAEVFGRMGNNALGGTVDYETVTPVQATGDNPPYTGEILVSGADGSEVRIVIVDVGVIRLEIDEDGDGVVDEFIDTTWDALSGEGT